MNVCEKQFPKSDSLIPQPYFLMYATDMPTCQVTHAQRHCCRVFGRSFCVQHAKQMRCAPSVAHTWLLKEVLYTSACYSTHTSYMVSSWFCFETESFGSQELGCLEGCVYVCVCVVRFPNPQCYSSLYLGIIKVI